MEIQKAGNNSQQYQIQNLTIQQGIDEKRAKEIYDENYSIAKRDFTEEARRISNERVKELENRLIPQIQAISGGLKAFADPSFQLLLIKAQKTAAATERHEDYDLLSELLIHRINKGNDRHIRAGIHRAVEIVEDISDEALLGLTIVHSVQTFFPRTPNINSVLNQLNDLFGKIIDSDLPLGIDWIDHLDILNAIRINPVGSFQSIEKGYTDVLDGIAVVGIKIDSEPYETAKTILHKNGLPYHSILIENPLKQGYVRLNVSCIKDIEDLHFQELRNGNLYSIPITKEQKKAIKSILDLYSKDNELNAEMQKNFMAEWMKHTNLSKLKEWWDQLPRAFSITSVGRVLAHANAQRCDKNLPSLNELYTTEQVTTHY